jgi:hypothetical protein
VLSAPGSQGRALLFVGMPSAFPYGQPIYVGKDHAGNRFLVFMGTHSIGSCLTENYKAFLVLNLTNAFSWAGHVSFPDHFLSSLSGDETISQRINHDDYYWSKRIGTFTSVLKRFPSLCIVS